MFPASLSTFKKSDYLEINDLNELQVIEMIENFLKTNNFNYEIDFKNPVLTEDKEIKKNKFGEISIHDLIISNPTKFTFPIIDKKYYKINIIASDDINIVKFVLDFYNNDGLILVHFDFVAGCNILYFTFINKIKNLFIQHDLNIKDEDSNIKDEDINCETLAKSILFIEKFEDINIHNFMVYYDFSFVCPYEVYNKIKNLDVSFFVFNRRYIHYYTINMFLQMTLDIRCVELMKTNSILKENLKYHIINTENKWNTIQTIEKCKRIIELIE